MSFGVVKVEVARLLREEDAGRSKENLSGLKSDHIVFTAMNADIFRCPSLVVCGKCRNRQVDLVAFYIGGGRLNRCLQSLIFFRFVD